MTTTEKTCSSCRETKPVNFFYKNAAQPDGFHNQCKACRRSKTRQEKLSQQEQDRLNGVKLCSGCQTRKPRYEFYRLSKSKDGRAGWCKTCENRRAATKYQENLERSRAYGRQAQAKRRAVKRERTKSVYDVEMCVYCLGPADTTDHVWATATGGTDHWSNYAPACLPCNQSKNDTGLLQFMLERKLT